MLNTRGSLSSDGNNKKRFESLANEIRVCLVSRERQRERETSIYDRRQSSRLSEGTRSVKISIFFFPTTSLQMHNAYGIQMYTYLGRSSRKRIISLVSFFP